MISLFSEAPRDFGDVNESHTASYTTALFYTTIKSRNTVVVFWLHSTSREDLLRVFTLLNRLLCARSRWCRWRISLLLFFFAEWRTTTLREFLLPLDASFCFLFLHPFGLTLHSSKSSSVSIVGSYPFLRHFSIFLDASLQGSFFPFLPPDTVVSPISRIRMKTVFISKVINCALK